MSWRRNMDNQGIEEGPSFDLKYSGHSKRIIGIRSQTIHRLCWKSYDPSLPDDLRSLTNGPGILHPDFPFLMAFDFSSNDFLVLDLKSSNFLTISGYLLDRISSRR